MTAEVIRRLKLAPCDIVAHSFGARGWRFCWRRHTLSFGADDSDQGGGHQKAEDGRGDGEAARVYKGLRGAVNLMDKTHLFGSLPERGREALVQKFGSADYKRSPRRCARHL